MQDLPPKSGRISPPSVFTAITCAQTTCQRRWPPTSIPLRFVRASPCRDRWLFRHAVPVSWSTRVHSQAVLCRSPDYRCWRRHLGIPRSIRRSLGVVWYVGVAGFLAWMRPLSLFRAMPHGDRIAHTALLDSAALAFVQSDIKGNIEVSCRDRFR